MTTSSTAASGYLHAELVGQGPPYFVAHGGPGLHHGLVVRRRCRQATVCLDAFHLLKWVSEALDQVRRQTWNEARRAGMRTHARDLKGARYALWKNPEVRHEAPLLPGGDERTPPSACRSRPPKLRAA